jgi:hypothetical protein
MISWSILIKMPAARSDELDQMRSFGTNAAARTLSAVVEQAVLTSNRVSLIQHREIF